MFKLIYQLLATHPIQAIATALFFVVFGRFQWILSLVQAAGILLAILSGYAWYHALFRHTEQNKLKYCKTPVESFGLFSYSKEAKPYSLCYPQTWQEYQRLRLQEATQQKLPTLLSIQKKKTSEEAINSMDSSHQLATTFQSIIEEMIQLILRDFIRPWYQKISPEPVILLKFESLLFHAAHELTKRIERLDIAQFIISKLLPALTIHIQEYKKAERLFKGERLQRNVTDSEEADYLLSRCFKGGKLHPALTTQPTSTLKSELTHLRKMLKPIIPLLLPKSEKESKLLLVLFREILACKILQPVLDLFSDPDSWNQLFDRAADGMIPQESYLSKKIKDAMERNDKSDQELNDSTDLLKPPSFEEYIEQIQKCDNLLDALNIRNTIEKEMSKKSLEIGYADEDIVNGTHVQDIRMYINRLKAAQKRIDKRIKALGGKAMGSTDGYLKNEPSILEILENPHSFASFAEYLDKVGRLHYLQFWMNLSSYDENVTNHHLDEFSMEGAKSLYSDIFMHPSWIEMNEILANDIKACYLLMEKKLSETLIQKWFSLLFKAKEQVLMQLQKVDYPLYLSFIQSSKASADHSDADAATEATSRMSNDSDMSRITFEEDKPQKKSFKIPKMFKRLRKASQESELGQSPDLSKQPSRRDQSENVEGELKSILTSEEGIFGRTLFKKRSRSKDFKASLSRLTEDSDTEKGSSSFLKPFMQRKKSPSSQPQESSLSTKFNLWSKSDEPKLSSDESEDILDDAFDGQSSVYSESATPFQLTIPDRIRELNNRLMVLNEEFSSLKNQRETMNELDSKQQRQLVLMQAGLQLELDRLKHEKHKIELEEFDNILSPEHTVVSIPESRSMKDSSRDSRHYTAYMIKITRINGNEPESGWTMMRRYSEFESLHIRLKTLFPFVQTLEFPGKIKGLMQPKKQLIEARRKALERYLKSLLQYPDLYHHYLLKQFLFHESMLPWLQQSNPSQVDTAAKKSFFKTLFKDKDASISNRRKADIESSPESKNQFELPSLTDDSLANFWKNSVTIQEPTEDVSATDAVIDLFIELFELKEKNNWLRRQAVVILLQQLFGGTVERRVTENLYWFGEIGSTVSFLKFLLDILWPGRLPFFDSKWTIRPTELKKKTRLDAQAKLLHLFPEILGSMVGKSNAKKGAERFCTIFQNRKLNQQLVYGILDEILLFVFPELKR